MDEAQEIAREIARELLRQGGHTPPADPGVAAMIQQVNENVQYLRADLRAAMESLASLKQSSQRHDGALVDHEERLSTAEDLIESAGLKDIAVVRQWIFKLGVMALVALMGLLAAASLLAPRLMDTLKKAG